MGQPGEMGDQKQHFVVQCEVAYTSTKTLVCISTFFNYEN